MGTRSRQLTSGGRTALSTTAKRQDRVKIFPAPIEAGDRAISDGEIRERIWNAIVDRSLLPGMRLKEEELNDIFHVGRSRIRKVLLQLQCEGLVDLVPNSGAFVAQPTVKAAREVFAARRLIEGELVRKLTVRMTGDDKADLETLIAAEGAAHEEGRTSDEIRLSGQFHIRIAELADSPILLGFLRELIPQTSLIIALYQPRQVGGCGVPDHNALIDAMAKGEADRAAELMGEHLERIENQLDLRQTEEQAVDLRRILGQPLDAR